MPATRAILVVDLAFGDCGKGTIVDHLVRETGARTVVRFNGGPQAAHNVVAPDGRHHTFAQLGSGTFVPGVRTLLSRFMLIEPYALLNEAAGLAAVGVPDALDRLTIDARCVVITPAHRAANRLRERARGRAAHGTCGLGFGEAVADSLEQSDLTLRAVDLSDHRTVRRKLAAIVEHKAAQLADVLTRADGPDADALRRPAWIGDAVNAYVELVGNAMVARAADALRCLTSDVIFEGAQGVLLDETFGFHPHTTWSTTTFANADRLLDEGNWPGRRRRVGVLRSYFTRHGAGPLVTEDAALRAQLPEAHNDDAGMQGAFRVGPFDAVAARYALSVTGPVDELAITHADRLPRLPPRICTAYEVRDESRITDLTPGPNLTSLLNACRPVYEPVPTDAFAERIARALRTPVGLISTGPTSNDKRRV